MKRLLWGMLGLLLAHGAAAQVNTTFVTGQVLTAGALNYAFSLAATVPPTCSTNASALQYGAGAWSCGTVANAGTNTNITSITGLTTPLGTWAGGLGVNNSAANGVPVFSAGAATVTAVTGTGSPVLATSPTLTTPTLTLPTVSGVTNGTAATAGNLGEYLCAQTTSGGTPTGCQANSSTPVALTSGVAANVQTLSLTAGIWQVCGNMYFSPNGATVLTQLVGQISTTSATLASPPNGGSGFLWAGSETGGAQGYSVGCKELVFTSTTSVYLVAQSSFTTNTNAAYGYIYAIRFH